ncbi:MAG TPA: multicopper oxidase domain-containing protein, partial [Longimicrobiales bacterium]|nr:multicopper oxidase domain-containing protein [Longimicrobiales bacterium]
MVSTLRSALTTALVAAFLPMAGASQEGPPSHLIPAGTESGLPRVAPNDNTVPAGRAAAGVREVVLEVVRADWRVETEEGPGLRVAAIGEPGAAPSIPAPLIRVEAGTRVRVTVHNRLEAPVTVFGLHARDGGPDGTFEVAPGAHGVAEFEAGDPGTYRYWMREGPEPDPESLDGAVER